VRFIKTRQVLAMLGVSRTTLWRLVQRGAFPQPVQVTGRNAHCVLQAVEAWMRARARGVPWNRANVAKGGSAPVRGGRSLTLARHAGGDQA
jgi:prophage regulatory protein